MLQRLCCGLYILSAKCLSLRPCWVSALSDSHTTTIISINTDGDLIPTLWQQVTQDLWLCWHHHRTTAGHTAPRPQHTANAYEHYIRKRAVHMLFVTVSRLELTFTSLKLITFQVKSQAILYKYKSIYKSLKSCVLSVYTCLKSICIGVNSVKKKKYQVI